MRRDRRLGGPIWTSAAAFAAAALLAFACDSSFPEPPGRCQPNQPNQCQASDGERYVCCSDDPAALDLANLDALALPAYVGGGGAGAPLFSSARNASSSSGMCVLEGAVPPAVALEDPAANGCPIPCNPTWSNQELALICGPNTICCQTVELEASDCVLDPALGSDGCWRPARGEDIVGLGGLEATRWTAAEHASLQDPGGLGCEDFVAGLSDAELDAAAVDRDEVMAACLRRLGVGNLRGFCLGGADVNVCPEAQPGYRDACEQRNDDEARDGCG